MLRCETNTKEMEGEVIGAAQNDLSPPHKANRLSADFEHGQWWITCLDCGAQWGAHDSSDDSFVFEQVTDGDEFCNGDDID